MIKTKSNNKLFNALVLAFSFQELRIAFEADNSFANSNETMPLVQISFFKGASKKRINNMAKTNKIPDIKSLFFIVMDFKILQKHLNQIKQNRIL